MSLRCPPPARERVHGRVEPPRLVVEAEPPHDLELEPRWRLEREAPRRPASAAARRAATSCTSGAWCSFRYSKIVAHLGGLHPALVVVEQRVVRLVVVAVEALDVAALAARGARAAPAGTAAKSFVARAPRPRPGSRAPTARDISARRSAGTLRAFSQSRRATRIRLASNESGSCSCLERRELVEQPADLRRGELLVRDRGRASRAARRGRPRRRGGIIVCWSQRRTSAARSRSVTSASSVRSSSNASAHAGTLPHAAGAARPQPVV